MTATTTPVGFRASLEALGGAQKSAKGAPAYSRWVNRRMGRWAAAAAHVAGLRPNHVTLVSALLTFTALGLVLAVRPTPGVSVAVGLLLVLGYALDAADGQLARLQGSGTVAGEWLDHVVDAVKTSSLHLVVLVALVRLDVPRAWLVVPLVFQVAASVHFFTMMLNDHLRRQRFGVIGSLTTERGTSSVAYSLAVLPTDYGLLCLALGLVGWPVAFLPVYTLLAAATTGFVALALPRWYREMSAQRADRPT